MLDCAVRNVFEVSQLQGTVWMRAAWNKLRSETMLSCWRHTRLLDEHEEIEPVTDLTVGGTEAEEMREIGGDIERLNPNPTRMTVSELLHPGEDESCTDSRSPDDITVSEAEEICNKITGKENSDDENELTTPEFSTNEALKSLAVVSTLLDGSNSDERIALMLYTARS